MTISRTATTAASTAQATTSTSPHRRCEVKRYRCYGCGSLRSLRLGGEMLSTCNGGHMRYSVTSVMLPDLSMQEQTALLQRFGYDGVEWWVRRVSEAQRAQGFSTWGAHRNDLTP